MVYKLGVCFIYFIVCKCLPTKIGDMTENVTQAGVNVLRFPSRRLLAPLPFPSASGPAGSVCRVAADASLVGPSPHGACGFSSAADTNRIRDDILPG